MLQLKIDRTKKSPLEYRKGANWFSITDDLAQYVVKNKKIIHKYFRYTICGDELFLQSLVYSSEYRKNISENNFCDNYETIKYVIDWKRGNPYVFRESDFEQLVSSGQLFARKFSWNLDKRIVEKIKEANNLIELIYSMERLAYYFDMKPHEFWNSRYSEINAYCQTHLVKIIARRGVFQRDSGQQGCRAEPRLCHVQPSGREQLV